MVDENTNLSADAAPPSKDSAGSSLEQKPYYTLDETIAAFGFDRAELETECETEREEELHTQAQQAVDPAVYAAALVLARKYSKPMKKNPNFNNRLWWKNLTEEERAYYLAEENSDAYATADNLEWIPKTDDDLVREACMESIRDDSGYFHTWPLTYLQVAQTLLADDDWVELVCALRTENRHKQ